MQARLTPKEEKFLDFYALMKERRAKWSYRSAAIYLGYNSHNSITKVINKLKKKGYIIETTRMADRREAIEKKYGIKTEKVSVD